MAPKCCSTVQCRAHAILVALYYICHGELHYNDVVFVYIEPSCLHLTFSSAAVLTACLVAIIYVLDLASKDHVPAHTVFHQQSFSFSRRKHFVVFWIVGALAGLLVHVVEKLSQSSTLYLLFHRQNFSLKITYIDPFLQIFEQKRSVGLLFKRLEYWK